MKTKYLFCHCVGQINCDTLFVDVYAGVTVQDRRDIKFLTSLADSQDYFFEKYSRTTAEFLSRIAVSLFPDEISPRLTLRHCTMPIRQLRKLLRSGDYGNFETTFVNATRALSRMHFCANDVYSLAMSNAVNNTLQSAHVKNLKPTRKAVWIVQNFPLRRSCLLSSCKLLSSCL